jgi:hypothetical protein
VTTPDDPTSTPGPVDDTNGDATALNASTLSPQDDAFVDELLAADASTDPLPPQIADRWTAALAAESAARAAATTVAATGAATAATTVVPIDTARSVRGRNGSTRGFRFAGIAASIAAIALVGGIVANSVLSSNGSKNGTDSVTTASGQQVPANAEHGTGSHALPVANTVTTSGLPYQPTKIAAQVKALLVGAVARSSVPAPGSLPLATTVTTPPPATVYLDPSTAATASPPGATVAPLVASTPDAGSLPSPTAATAITPAPKALASINADPMATTFRTDAQRRADCLAELNSGPGARPVVMDLGFFQGSPAALVVLPTDGDDLRLDVWIVGPDCSKGNGHVLWFGRVVRP